jgi:aspartate 1-decarboxylase
MLMLAVATSFALAQDPGMQAAQAAQMAAQQATQQANDQMNQAAQQANQTMMQNAQQAAQNTPQCYRCASKPKFSVNPGVYATTLTVRMKDSTRGAIIYYTTDGWTPTAASTRYVGAITINSTTTLQAIAVSPYGGRSRVATAVYTLNGAPQTAPVAPSAALAPNAASGAAASTPAKLLLAHGTAVPLVFAADVSSKTAEVGDKIPLTLVEDLKAGGVVVARKGTPAVATVTEVDKTGIGGVPGEVFFQVDSLQAGSVLIKLHGGAAKQGQDEQAKSVGFLVFVHGKNAEIKQGAPFTAFVDADTPISSAN